MPLSKSSIFIPIPNTSAKLHLKRFHGSSDVVFMVHGAIENGKIFYSESDKGLAPFLAKKNFDVYVLDLRGRGQSTPAINDKADYGQSDSIMQELPLALNKIIELRGQTKQHWIAHSWGGTLLSALLARQPELISNVSSQIYFGSKRSIRIKSFKRLFYIDFIWNMIGKLLIKTHGFLPAKKFKLGADSESKKSHRQSLEWVYGPWIDSDDQFNYALQLKKLTLPPTLFIAAINDHTLGHPKDVLRFMNECGQGIQRYQLLSKQSGNLHNYNHIDMLTHQLAEKDHFITVLDWIEKYRPNI